MILKVSCLKEKNNKGKACLLKRIFTCNYI